MAKDKKRKKLEELITSMAYRRERLEMLKAQNHRRLRMAAMRLDRKREQRYIT